MNFVHEHFAKGCNPGERLTAIEWMAKNVVIPHSARNTTFDPSTAPWMVEPISEIAKDFNDEIVIAAPVGSGKTTLFECLLAWIVSENPGPTLVTGQTDKTSKDWAESRLEPMFQAIPIVRGLFPRDRHAKRKTEILFRHMPLFMVGANLTALQEKSIRWAIADEVWRWKKGMVEEFRRRTHDRWNARRVLVSQGGFDGDDFHDAEDMAENREWCWRCECGAVHAWDFKDVKFERFDEAGRIDWNLVSNTAKMVCPTCGKEFHDDPVTRRGLAASSFYAVTKKGAPGRIAFHYDASAVWWIPWGSLAVEWVKAEQDAKAGDKEALRQFRQKRNARRWIEQGNGATDDQVLACRGEYHKGRCPIDPVALTVSADVGQDTTHYTVTAWQLDMTCHVIDYGTVVAVEDLLDLAGTLQYQTPSGKTVLPIGGMIDSGYNAEGVYKVCHLSGGYFFPVRGSNASFGTGGETVLKDYPNMPLYTLGEYASKMALFDDRIAKRKPPFLYFPLDSSEEFLSAFMGQKVITNKKGRREWQKVANDHYADSVRINYKCATELRKSGVVNFEIAPQPTEAKK